MTEFHETPEKFQTSFLSTVTKHFLRPRSRWHTGNDFLFLFSLNAHTQHKTNFIGIPLSLYTIYYGPFLIDWLTGLIGFLTKKPDSMVGGEVINGLPGNLFSSASQVLISSLYSYYNKNPDRAHFFTANNIALSKKCFLAVGGFDHKWGMAAAEDREFCDRWLLQGYQMTYAPEAVIYHVHSMSLFGFWDQHFNYGRGAYYFHQARYRREKGHMKIEPLSFYLNLIRYPFLRFKKIKAAFISGLIVLAQAANVVGFFWEQVSKKTSKNKLAGNMPLGQKLQDSYKRDSTNP